MCILVLIKIIGHSLAITSPRGIRYGHICGVCFSKVFGISYISECFKNWALSLRLRMNLQKDKFARNITLPDWRVVCLPFLLEWSNLGSNFHLKSVRTFTTVLMVFEHSFRFIIPLGYLFFPVQCYWRAHAYFKP